MDASAAHARVAIGLLIAAALAVPAAPARAQEPESTAPPEIAPLPAAAPQEATVEVEETLPPAAPEPAVGQEPGVAEENRLAEPEPEPAIQAQAQAGVEVALDPTPPPPQPTIAPPQPTPAPPQPTTAPPQPAGSPDHSPVRSPDPVAPADPKPEQAVEPGARMLRRVDARLRGAERRLRRVHEYVDAGKAPPPGLLVGLRRSVQRLLPAVAVLERHAAEGVAPVAGLDAIRERLEYVRGAAAALVAAFQGRAVERTLQHALATRAPADPAAVAYTQTHSAPGQAQSEMAPIATRSPVRTQKLPEGPRPWPAPPATPSGGVAVGPSGSFFSFAGPAALALLLGLAIPRVLRRLARLPAGRQSESFWSPPERPG
jgi:hypothetical protein